MARNNAPKIELTAYDDLFQTDESREEAKLSKIRDIPISQIDEFPDHPFKVLMNEDMEQLVESVKRNGVMTPATVRLKGDGRYELISGHRRKKACELAGLETLKCEVKELTRDEAIIIMVDEQRIAFRPAVEISYLTEEQQYSLLEAMEYNDATPSLAQAIKMKKFNQDGKLTDEVIQSIMEEEKPNQKEKPAFRDERITKLIPKSIPRGQETDFVVKALEFYNRHLQRSKAQER